MRIKNIHPKGIILSCNPMKVLNFGEEADVEWSDEEVKSMVERKHVEIIDKTKEKIKKTRGEN